jgi:hypothetical protein
VAPRLWTAALRRCRHRYGFRKRWHGPVDARPRVRYLVIERFIDERGRTVMKSSTTERAATVAPVIVAPGMRRLSGMLAVRRIVER